MQLFRGLYLGQYELGAHEDISSSYLLISMSEQRETNFNISALYLTCTHTWRGMDGEQRGGGEGCLNQTKIST